MLVPDERLADPVSEAAVRLGISRSRLYHEIKNGRISAVKAGGRTLVTREAQMSWLASLPVAASFGRHA